jgi:hypothetical protein
VGQSGIGGDRINDRLDQDNYCQGILAFTQFCYRPIVLRQTED